MYTTMLLKHLQKFCRNSNIPNQINQVSNNTMISGHGSVVQIISLKTD